ncbi:MAG: sigma-70 family RNA polymerase sigma factor [Clostridia bacterium]|nr:sigma-70 family RNA polymerase sigma factor [Clostridia bacterium]
MSIDKTALSKLIIKLQQGDGMVFEDIYNATRESAYFTALKISKSEDDAEDILQESYIYMLENIGAVENPDSFQSWFNRVVANKAKDLLRKNHPERFADAYFSNDEGEEASIMDFVENEDESFIPEASLDNAELAHEVMKMIDSLGDDKRTAVVLYYYNDMTTKEIAESLGVNENTVKSRLVQAKKDIVRAISEYEKKHGKLIGVAPISVVRWALRYSGTDSFRKEYSDFAPLLEKVQEFESQGFSVLEKFKFHIADFFSHFGSAGSSHDKGAGLKPVAAIIATAGVIGGAVAGTNAIRSRNSEKNAETTTTVVEQIDEQKLNTAETTIKRSDEDSNFLGETLEVPEGEMIEVRSNLVTGRYGVRFSSQDYARNTRNGVETYYGKPVADRSGFSATYDEMLPYAKQNMQTYSGEITSVLNKINDIRSGSGSSSLTQDEKLSEQAGVRAEEIAWSGRQNSIRPDGTSYTTVFDQNGYTSGTRLEVRAYGKTAADIFDTLSSDESIKNRDISKIGVGVSENPETGALTFVVHLYSERGSLENIIGIGDIFRDRKDDISDIGTEFAGDRIDNLNNFAEEIKDVPVIGPLFTSDTPLDVVTMKINEWIESIREQRTENKELGN